MLHRRTFGVITIVVRRVNTLKRDPTPPVAGGKRQTKRHAGSADHIADRRVVHYVCIENGPAVPYRVCTCAPLRFSPRFSF